MLMMRWEPLPATVAVVVLLLAAVLQAYARRVPNALTIPAILAGWLFSIHVDATNHAMWPGPAFQASLAGSFLAMTVLLPLYASHRLGAGCVKAQMAFGAWLGCALPLLPSLALITSATVAGLVFTFVVLRMTVAEIPGEERHNYEFPAQVTITVTTISSVLACWSVSYPT